MIHSFELELRDSQTDEAFFEESFATGKRKLSNAYQREIFELLRKSLKRYPRYPVESEEEISLLWVQLDDILESSIFRIRNKDEFSEFLIAKNQHNLTAEFYLEKISMTELPEMYRFYFPEAVELSGFLMKGICETEDGAYTGYYYLQARNEIGQQLIHELL